MRTRVASFDWARTAVGPRDDWPQSLRTAVNLVLASAFPMIVLWGPELVQIYNDGYAVVLGERHPAALGQPTRTCWPEVWHINEPLYMGVRRGQTFYFENLLFPITRYGYLEEAYFTVCYSPVLNDGGEVGGVLVTTAETTVQVLYARRLNALREHAEATAQAQTIEELQELVRSSRTHPDVPFVALFLKDEPGSPPPEVLMSVIHTREPKRLDWVTGHEHPRMALALPVDGIEHGDASGALVLGLNPQVPLDDAYLSFLSSYARQAAAALVRVRSGEQARLNRKLEEERAALDAFATFTEAVGTEIDIGVLAGRAVEVLLARYPGGTCVYYEPEGELWRARVWSDDLRPDLLEVLRSGLPETTPFVAQALREHRAVFTDEWNPAQQEVQHTEEYGRSAHVPIMLGGTVRGLLGLASRDRQDWRERDKALLDAVARGFTLALERAEQTRRLDEERGALSAFARFTELTAGSSDVSTLAQRAADVLRTTLNVPSAVCFEQDGELWKARCISGSVSPALERLLYRGIPLGTPSLALPVARREPTFFEPYDAHGDRLPEGEPYQATGRYPLFPQDHPVGILGMASVDTPAWTEREKAVFRAVGDSFRLALERTARTQQIERQRERLADLNAELGNLITRTAHNLEAPARRLGHLLGPGQPPAEGLPSYDPAALQDEVTRLSGVARDLRQLASLEQQQVKRELLPLGELFAELRAKVAATPGKEEVGWLIGTLPIVRGDRALLQQALEVLMTFTLSETRGARYVTVSSREIEGEVQVTVEDDGVGLSGKEAATLFDLTVRTGQDVPPLEGSGLIQVRRILAWQGGWVWAEAQRTSGKVVLAFPRDGSVSELEALFRQDKPGL